ncbi:hypothetical protein NZK35_23390 [Stieleria sp. ICT_E10.1]|uniref:hypothetical protein n=1 Tax=Stieleria sedimenti TaxID=2976331 RepID=UPI00217FCBAC|nr:hypothetical protein [Stieleria sedimenti]MCS7469605.1 hypothetical protein [Stieleria sedimenti]
MKTKSWRSQQFDSRRGKVSRSPRAPRRRLSIETLETRRLLAVDLLYLGNQADNSIQVFDAGTGAFVRTLVQSGASSLQGPRGMVVQGNNLLVVNQNVDTQFNGEVLRFNLDTGAALSPLVPSSSTNAPFAPRGIVVKDNVAYVADFFASPSRIGKYNATTGAFIGSLIPNGFNAEFNPRGLVFGPDGRLVVPINAGSASGSVRAYDVTTENFAVLIPTSNGRLQTPWYLTFGKTDAATLAYNTTTAFDRAPVLAGIEATPQAYQVKAPKKVVSQSITVTDVDSTVLTGATIRITNNYQSGVDVLSLGGPPVVQSSWNPTTGTLTLSGTATLAKYQGALRCILFENTSLNPTTGQRRIVFQVTGGAVTSNQVSRDIRMVAVVNSIAATQTFAAPTLASDPVIPPPPSQVDAAVTIVSPAPSDPSGAEVQSAFLSSQPLFLDSNFNDRGFPDGEFDSQLSDAKPLVATTARSESIAPDLVDESLDSLYRDSLYHAPLSGEPHVQDLGDAAVELLQNSLFLTR